MGRERAEMDFEQGRRAIVEKRKARQRKKRIAALKRFTVFMAIILVMVLAVLSLTVLFPIKTIKIEEDTSYTPEQIIKASGIQKGQNLWMSGTGAKEKIVKELPYISDIIIKRKFPSTIIVSAKKATPALCYKRGNEFYVCDKNNKLLEITKNQPENVTQILGLTANKTNTGYIVGFKNPELFEILSSLMTELDKNSIKVNKIKINSTVDIYFEIEDRFKVEFGSSANIQSKISHLVQMLENIDESLTGKINLSVWTPDNPRGSFTQGA